MKPEDWKCPRFSGPKLVDRRVEANLTQAGLARKVGMSAATIGQYEKGRAVPGANALMELCAALRCKAEDLCEVQL